MAKREYRRKISSAGEAEASLVKARNRRRCFSKEAAYEACFVQR